MKVYAKDILSALRKVKYNKMHVLPILNGVYVKLNGDTLTLTTTDLDTSKTEKVKVFNNNNESWEVVVPLLNPQCKYNDVTERFSKGYPIIDLLSVHAETKDLLDISCELNRRVRVSFPKVVIREAEQNGHVPLKSVSTINCFDFEEFPKLFR